MGSGSCPLLLLWAPATKALSPSWESVPRPVSRLFRPLPLPVWLPDQVLLRLFSCDSVTVTSTGHSLRALGRIKGFFFTLCFLSPSSFLGVVILNSLQWFLDQCPPPASSLPFPREQEPGVSHLWLTSAAQSWAHSKGSMNIGWMKERLRQSWP